MDPIAAIDRMIEDGPTYDEYQWGESEEVCLFCHGYRPYRTMFCREPRPEFVHESDCPWPSIPAIKAALEILPRLLAQFVKHRTATHTIRPTECETCLESDRVIAEVRELLPTRPSSA